MASPEAKVPIGMDTSVPTGPDGKVQCINLKTSEIAYLHHDSWKEFQDVFILTNTGKKLGFNRCMLAALSWFFKDIFMELYECPLANLDEVIYVSSNYTEDELESFREFFLKGKLPEVDLKTQQSFLSMGLDMNNLMGAFNEKSPKKITAPLKVAMTFMDL